MMRKEDPLTNKLFVFVFISAVIIVANFAYMIKTNFF
jgi:hypothetical protein